MKSIIIHIAPLFSGALFGIIFGTGVTRLGSWPNIQYRILGLDPMARNLAFVGLMLLGAGLGGGFASILRSAGDGDIEFSPVPNQRFVWQNFSVTVSLIFAGLLALAIGVYVL